MAQAANPSTGEPPKGWPVGSWTAAWRVVIASRIAKLNAAVARPEAGLKADPNVIQRGIDLATSAARLNGEGIRPLDWLGQWATGSAIENSWRGLHSAEEEFVLIAEEDWLLARLSSTQETLQALGIIGRTPTEAQKAVMDIRPPLDNPKQRQMLKATLAELNSESDSYHANLRRLRDILFTTTMLLVAGLVAMALAGALAPNVFSLCGVPAPSPCNAPSVLEVEIAGGFGGLLSAVVFLSNLPTQDTPYTIWFFQGLLKAPTGAALAVIVVFLVQTGLVGFLKADPSFVIAYALVFGFAQQAATQVVDKWATGIVKASPTSKGKDAKK